MASHTINQQPGGVKSTCPVCTLLRDAGVGACSTHVIHDPWRARGHASPHDAAYAYLAWLDEVLGALLPDPLALVGSLCVARLRRALAVESSALGADRTRLDLLTALGMRALRGAA